MSKWIKFKATRGRRAWVDKDAVKAVVEEGDAVSLHLSSDFSEASLFIDEPISKVLSKLGIEDLAPSLVGAPR